MGDLLSRIALTGEVIDVELCDSRGYPGCGLVTRARRVLAAVHGDGRYEEAGV